MQEDKRIMKKEEIKELVAMTLKDHKIIFERLQEV
jgi:hypothetical protein